MIPFQESLVVSEIDKLYWCNYFVMLLFNVHFMKTLRYVSHGSVPNVMSYSDDVHSHACFKLCHQPTH